MQVIILCTPAKVDVAEAIDRSVMFGAEILHSAEQPCVHQPVTTI